MGSEPGTAAFSGQDKDGAYKNLWTYVAYAMAVSDLFPHWRIVNAEFRYEREIAIQFEDLAAHLLPEITEESDIRKTIDSTYIKGLRDKMLLDLSAGTVNSASRFQSTTKDHIGDLEDLMKLARMVSEGFVKFSGEAFLKQILVDDESAIAAKIITEGLEDKLDSELITELYSHFQSIIGNLPVDFAGAKKNIDAIVKNYLDNLKLLDGYIPFVKEVRAIETSVRPHMEKLKGQLPTAKQAEWQKSFDDIRITLMGFDQDDMYDTVTKNIIAGKAFDPKNKPGDPEAVIKTNKKELDEEYKLLKARK